MIETTTVGVGSSAGQKRFIRVDLTNAEYSNLGVAGTGTLTATGTTTPAATGGNTSSTTVTSMGGNGTTSGTIDVALDFPDDCVSKTATTTATTTAGGATNVKSVSQCFAKYVPANTMTVTASQSADIAFFTASSAPIVIAPGGATISNVEVALGGSAGDDFVIFEVTAGTTGVPLNTQVTFTPAVAVSGSAGVAMNVYETLVQANETRNELASASGTFVVAALGLSTTATPANQVAEVASDFTLFATLGGGTTDDGTLGSINWDLATAAEAAEPTTGGALVTGDIINAATSTVTLLGDTSFGDWYLDDTACTGKATGEIDLVEAADGLSAAPATAGVAGLKAAHIVCVEMDGDEVINEGPYSVSFDWTPAAGTVTPAEDTEDVVGAISRNGTTVQIPYITTFTDYNQRVVLVNRSSNPAEYSISFTTEAGTTATPGDAASGEIPANSVLSLKAVDVVTITGDRTRTAATVTIVAPSTVIDVATNQVNTTDGSTDTVVYN
ncbi:MAG: hypothetical protein JJ854_02125 [Pseudomonadales bacterium]|nr:hypothetical protein [Pseudomonadales bacterium]